VGHVCRTLEPVFCERGVIVLNGIDANRPGQAYNYAGMGYDLTAKAMELTGPLALYLQAKESVYDLVWTPGVTYGDVTVSHHRLELFVLDGRGRAERLVQATVNGVAAGLRNTG